MRMSWEPDNPQRPRLSYVWRRFLRYGLLAWGGPVAQIGLMHRELVERDRWVDETRFRKVLALYQALPGPEALELAVYFGYTKRGRWGGFLAGLAFMTPGVLLVTLLAALYLQYASGSQAVAVARYGLAPAVVALVAVAFLRLAKASLPDAKLLLIAVTAAFLAALRPDLGFVPVLLLGGLAHLALVASWRPPVQAAWLPMVAFLPEVGRETLVALAWLSAKVGLLTFGGAYTAIPFLQRDAVEEHGWLTNEQFLDGLAIVGMVPAPLISIAVFVGYAAAGLVGAGLATLLAFAPAFAFTLLGHTTFERMVEEPRLHAFLLGVTAAVIGLILVALLPLGFAALYDVPTILIAVATAVLLWWRRTPIPLLLALAGLTGVLVQRFVP